MVGVERFELPTSCSQSRRATRLRYTPSCRIDRVSLVSMQARKTEKSTFFARSPKIHQTIALNPFELDHSPLHALATEV